MLELKNVTKVYGEGETQVDALKGVSLQFRKSEFVSILGPSGCGKTTLLNIVGGLDRYTDGDLIINGVSTKDYGDRDWDAYRNHSIGFVFQSYNLIPHQTVLQNVELALALSGVKKAERVTRAKAALDSVGLKNMYHKRPNEMSGGQMQRVAIARAIVNNPDIVLADEPTGALDSETSVQVMDILKEISKDRLVVMVTHNPELAKQYSTRVVTMLDGLMVNDSNPLSKEELAQEKLSDDKQVEERKLAKKSKKKKPSMSFFTSFALSLKNLVSKRGRTTLTSFAGSIGIIGIALIFAVSQGTTNYINAVQEDTLASYPLTIEQTHTDMSSMFKTFVSGAQGGEHDKDAIYEKLALYNLTNAITKVEQSENDLAAFKKFLDTELADSGSVLSQSLNGVHYSYDLDLLVYTKNIDGTIMRADTGDIMTDLVSTLYGVDMSQVSFTGSGLMSTLMSTGASMSMWQELLPATDGGAINKLLKDQYDIVYGKWPDSGSAGKNQIVLVVDENNEIDDMTLYALGLKSREEIDAIIDAARNGTDLPEANSKKWSYEEICSQKYKTIFNYECYKQFGNTWYDVRDMETGLADLYNDKDVGLELEVVGIVRPNPDASSHMLSGNICYTQELTKYVIEKAQNSDIVKAQKENSNVDVFTGKYFQDNNLPIATKAARFKEYIDSLSDNGKATVFLTINSVPTEEEIASAASALSAMDTETLRTTLKQMLSSTTSPEQLNGYIDGMADEKLKDMIPTIAPSYAQMGKAMALQQAYTRLDATNNPYVDMSAMAQKLVADMANYTDEQCAQFFDEVIEFSSTSYEDNLATLGCFDLASPSSVSLYAISFAAKEEVENEIARYNDSLGEDEQEKKIQYVDYVGIIMSSVTTIIDAITYVLIGFVSISLIVSSIMIGVITLISVQERTKEIGILRAIGASKRNVSGMFNAETVIIGFSSGVLGVAVTYVLSIIVNLILHSLTGIMTLNATLPIWFAAVLVGISMLLTLIAGIIPSASASKKDPVVALRTE